jgi:hypothetical protein
MCRIWVPQPKCGNQYVSAACCLLPAVADVVVMLNRNLEYCSYGSTALFGTDDFDELEQQFNKV